MKKLFVLLTLGSFSLLIADQYYQQYGSPQQDYRQIDNSQYPDAPSDDKYNSEEQNNQQQFPHSNYSHYDNKYQQNRDSAQPSIDIQVNIHDKSSMERQNSPDDELSKNVHDSLYGWISKRNNNIAFEVNDGVVTLTGFVESQEEKNKIEESVKNIRGVKQVDNKINVSEPKKMAYYQPKIIKTSNTLNAVKNSDQRTTKDYAALDSDKKINAQIRSKLNGRAFNAVVIITANGIVTLGGHVDNLEDFKTLVKDIEKMDGVKKVNNKVTEKKQN